MVTDGPFQEFKEWIAGYQIMDVESEARAIEIAGRISAVPGPNGTRSSSRSRCAADGVAPSNHRDGEWLETVGRDALTPTSNIEDLLRELAPQVLGALVRRYGDFDAAEDAVQEALVAAATRWPKEGVPDDQWPGWYGRPAPADRPVAQRRVAPSARGGCRDRPRPHRRIAPTGTTPCCCSSSAAIRR